MKLCTVIGILVTLPLFIGFRFISFQTQHLKFGALRAIETRRWIARSANTGISCFINPAGEVEQATDWWKPAVISGQIKLMDKQTFYTRFGDYVARAAIYLSLLFLLYSWLMRFKIIRKQKEN